MRRITPVSVSSAEHIEALEAAQEAASSACSPADTWLECRRPPGALDAEGLIDPDHLNLAIVHVTADGQPDGQLARCFLMTNEEDTDSPRDDD